MSPNVSLIRPLLRIDGFHSDEQKHLDTIKRILEGEKREEDVSVGSGWTGGVFQQGDPAMDAFYGKMSGPKQSVDVEAQILNARSEVTVKFPTSVISLHIHTHIHTSCFSLAHSSLKSEEATFGIVCQTDVQTRKPIRAHTCISAPGFGR